MKDMKMKTKLIIGFLVPSILADPDLNVIYLPSCVSVLTAPVFIISSI